MIRSAVRGCGRIGAMRADNFTAHPRAVLAADCSINLAAATTVAGKPCAKVLHPVAVVLAKAAIESVAESRVICTSEVA